MMYEICQSKSTVTSHGEYYQTSRTNEGCSSTSKTFIQKSNPKKAISILEAFSIIFGTIVGAGIFKGVQEPYGIFDSNDIAFITLFWFTFGVISILGGLCYAELGTRIPQSGGDRAYLKEILSEKFAVVFVIFFVFIIKPLSMAGLAITISVYIAKMFISNPDSYWWTIRIAGFVVLIACLIIVNLSKAAATKTGVVTTILKTIAMLIIIGSGIYSMIKGNVGDWYPPFKMNNFSSKQFGMAMLVTFWAHDGANTLGLVAGDMNNPARDLPIAIIVGMGMVVVLYVLTVISYATILGYSAARHSTAIAFECGQVIFGKFAPIMSILICISAFGSITSTLYSVSSAGVSAGVSGELPILFSLVNRKKRTPVFISIVVILVAGIFTLFDFNSILGYASFTSLAFQFLVYIALWVIKIRTRHTKQKGVFHAPYFLIVPIQLLCLGMIVLSFIVQTYGTIFLTFLLFTLYGIQFLPHWNNNRFTHVYRKFQHRIIRFGERRLSLELANMDDIS